MQLPHHAVVSAVGVDSGATGQSVVAHVDLEGHRVQAGAVVRDGLIVIVDRIAIRAARCEGARAIVGRDVAHVVEGCVVGASLRGAGEVEPPPSTADVDVHGEGVVVYAVQGVGDGCRSVSRIADFSTVDHLDSGPRMRRVHSM